MKEYNFESIEHILRCFQDGGYEIVPISEFFNKKTGSDKTILLRHDVDRFPGNSLKMAKLEYELGISATYYFRIIPVVFKENIMKEIAAMGHEVSYHYEDLTLCKGDYEKAIKHFEHYINEFRKFVPAKTICRHGSPLSKWDNKKLWEKYNYKDFGIIADTEFDIDFNKVFYITDNGWGWNNTAASVRDKVKTCFDIPIHDSFHFMKLIENDQLPDKIMINAHPDTFFDDYIPWLLNKTMIKSKNLIKKQIVKYGIIK